MKFGNIILFSFLTLAFADDGFEIYHRTPFIIEGCEALINKNAVFFGKKVKNGWCKVAPALGTISHCLVQSNSTKAIDLFQKQCNLTSEDFYAAYDNATKYLVKKPQDDPAFNKTEPYNKPIKFAQIKVDGAINSTVGRWMNYNYGAFFGLALISYWFFLILASGVINILYFITPSFVHSFNGKVSNVFRKYITMPPLGKKYHNDYYYLFKVFPYLIPTRAESIMVGGWLVLNVAFLTANYEHESPNIIWPVHAAEMGRKIADRTGIMALFVIPSMVLFSGRNNFLQLLSGWKYSRFILIHKWLARLVSLYCLLHAIGMTYNGKNLGKGKYDNRNKQPYVRWGYVCLISMFLMCFHSIHALRKTRYELFSLFHIILGTFVMVGGWLHVKSQEYQNFFWAAIAVWVFDRAVRIFRLVAFGVREAEVQLIADETLKVKVQRPSYWIPFPGAHAYIHFMRPTCFWQSHPFTIVDEYIDTKTITFYLKVKGGMTHGLYQHLSKQPENKATIKVTIEGPYGKKLPLSRYQKNVFISSGNGIPGVFYEAKDLTVKKPDTTIKFYWIIRHWKSIEWFYEELLKLADTNVETTIYVTNGSLGFKPWWDDSDSSSSSDGEKKEEISEKDQDLVNVLKTKMNHITFVEGRPALKDLVVDEIKETNTPVAFVTCCHAAIDDDVRHAIANNLDKTAHRVDLFDQIQVW